MTQILIANEDKHSAHIRELFWEYLEWANSHVNEEFGVNFDIAAMLEEDMRDLDKFMPPRGRLLLAGGEDHPTGIACLKELTSGIGEIKRMYVRPEARRMGLGPHCSTNSSRRRARSDTSAYDWTAPAL